MANVNKEMDLILIINTYFSDASTPSTTTGSPVPEATSSSSETDESKLSLAAALEHPASTASTASTTNSNGSNLNESGIETDLRKSLVKSRLGQVTSECQLTEVRLPRSDSIDSMLGDSLLDPPQVTNLIVFMMFLTFLVGF